MTHAETERYEKTVKTRFALPSSPSPKDMISGTPIKLFGKTVLIKWRIAKPGYQWALDMSKAHVVQDGREWVLKFNGKDIRFKRKDTAQWAIRFFNLNHLA